MLNLSPSPSKNPYTTSASLTDAYKKLICGRKSQLEKVLDLLKDGNNVIIFGRSGAGKTSFLYILKDVINGTIIRYKDILVDSSLKEYVSNSQPSLLNTYALFLDLQALVGNDRIGGLIDLINNEIEMLGKELLTASLPQILARPSSLHVFFQELNTECKNANKQYVILMDEMNALALDSDAQILGNLKSVAKSCQHIRFVYSGTGFWHKAADAQVSFLPPNQSLYLANLDDRSVKEYLVQQLHIAYPDAHIDKVADLVFNWTGGQPLYVQSICSTIFLLRPPGSNAGRRTLKQWERTVSGTCLTELTHSFKKIYGNRDNGTDKADVKFNKLPLDKRILILLAHHPRMREKKIAQWLRISKEEVSNELSGLMNFYYILKQGSKYHIIGTLVERWGRDNESFPLSDPKRWSRLAGWVVKCVICIIFLFLAGYAYSYTHPAQQTISFPFSSGEIILQVPMSLEQDESGAMTVSVHNTSSTRINDVIVRLDSSDIDYQLKGTNLIAFSDLEPGETKSLTPSFLSNSSLIKSDFTSSVSITLDGNTREVAYPFTITARMLPLKSYWAAISGIFGALAVFGLFGQNILSWLVSAISGNRADKTI